jgi:DNA-binding SARP family transcriptional activator/pimeloyl-ACP methyl ester carboxylesterase
VRHVAHGMLTQCHCPVSPVVLVRTRWLRAPRPNGCGRVRRLVAQLELMAVAFGRGVHASRSYHVRIGAVVRVLGPLEVVINGADVTPAAPKERALLALLALRGGQVVSADRLIEELWPELAADAARHVLQVRVAAIRKTLRAAGAAGIGYRSGGYVLDVGPDEIDEAPFRDLVDAGSRQMAANDAEAAAATLRAALNLWRGEPLADSRGSVTLDAEAIRLADARIGALEDRIDADLACGRHGLVVSELEALIAIHPLRERLWAQRVVALYRCGRQSEALRACATVRRLLAEELGIDPGAVLQALEAAVLSQSPDLDWHSHRTGEGLHAASTVRPTDTRPPVHYVRTADGVNIAYQISGNGPTDLIVIQGLPGHLDVWWDGWSGRLARALASFSRVIVYDKRGTGLSDRPPHSTAEEWMEDICAVLDAAGSTGAVVLGMSMGGAIGSLFAATHSERTHSLILYGAAPRYLRSDDYPIGTSLETHQRTRDYIESSWGTGALWGALCPSQRHNPSLRADYARFQRLAASPGAAAAWYWDLCQIDVREALPRIRARTLVLHTRGDHSDPVERARYMAERIPGARMVEFDSPDHLIWVNSAMDQLIEEIRDFVGVSGKQATERPHSI